MTTDVNSRESIYDPEGYVRELLRTADNADGAPMPRLVAAELHVLLGEEQAVLDIDVLAEWAALSEPARRELSADVVTSLLERGLLTPRTPHAETGSRPDGPLATTGYDVHPALGVILTARSNPTWSAVCVSDGQWPGLRVFGFGDRENPWLAAVVEVARKANQRTEGHAGVRPGGATLTSVYDYALVSLRKAMEVLAEWAAEPDSASSGCSTMPRAIDFVRSLDDRRLSRHRIAISRSSHIVTVADADSQNLERHERCTIQDLPALLGGMFRLEF
jgi:hypothetical protein